MQTNGSKSCLSAGPFADFGAECSTQMTWQPDIELAARFQNKCGVVYSPALARSGFLPLSASFTRFATR